MINRLRLLPLGVLCLAWRRRAWSAWSTAARSPAAPAGPALRPPLRRARPRTQRRPEVDRPRPEGVHARRLDAGAQERALAGHGQAASEQAFKKADQPRSSPATSGAGRLAVLHRLPGRQLLPGPRPGHPERKKQQRPGRAICKKQEDGREGRRQVLRRRRAGQLGRLPAEAAELGPAAARHHLAREADDDHPELPWIDTRRPLRKAAKKHDDLRAPRQPLDAVRRLRRLEGDHQVPAGLRPGPEPVSTSRRSPGSASRPTPTSSPQDGVPRQAAPHLPDLRRAAPGDDADPHPRRRAGRRASGRLGRHDPAAAQDVDAGRPEPAQAAGVPRLHRQRPVAAVEQVLRDHGPVRPRTGRPAPSTRPRSADRRGVPPRRRDLRDHRALPDLHPRP